MTMRQNKKTRRLSLEELAKGINMNPGEFIRLLNGGKKPRISEVPIVTSYGDVYPIMKVLQEAMKFTLDILRGDKVSGEEAEKMFRKLSTQFVHVDIDIVEGNMDMRTLHELFPEIEEPE